MTVWDFPNLSPSVCFICEGAEPGAKFLDTFKDYSSGGIFSPLNGRKYLCSICVRDAADEFGMFDDVRADGQALVADARAQLAEAREKLAGYEALDAMLKQLSVAVEPKQKPQSAKALKKADA